MFGKTETTKIPIVIAADFGYGMTKTFNGRSHKGVASMVGEPKQINFKTEFKKGEAAMEDLHYISTEINGERRFIGDFALRQSPVVFKAMDKNKIMYKDTMYLMKVSTALVVEDGMDVQLITGLPVAHYNEENKQKFSEILMGAHTVKFDWDRDGSYKHAVNFNIVEVKVIPQPMGTFFDYLLTSSGEVNKENIDDNVLQCLTQGSVAIIDVGYGTTDFCVVRDLEYIEKSSGSLDKAMGTVFEMIANSLVQESGVTIPPHVLTDTTLKRGTIAIEGKTYNLNDVKERAIQSVFEEISLSIKAAWRSEYQIDAFIFTGGGSIAMHDLFANRFGNNGVVLFPKSPVFSNVMGYWKYRLRENIRNSKA